MKYPELDGCETYEDEFLDDPSDFDEGTNDPWGDDGDLDEEDDEEE